MIGNSAVTYHLYKNAGLFLVAAKVYHHKFERFCVASQA